MNGKEKKNFVRAYFLTGFKGWRSCHHPDESSPPGMLLLAGKME